MLSGEVGVNADLGHPARLTNSAFTNCGGPFEARKAYAFLSATVSSALRTSFVADLQLREQRLHRVFRFQKTDDIP